MQTAALRYHTNMDSVFLTAPYPAEGPPDPGIAEFYESYDYFEWFYKRVDHSNEDTVKANILLGLESSLCQIVEYINEYGPFDGILGFSQGSYIHHISSQCR
jgi:Serine hydrolase (FSH1)